MPIKSYIAHPMDGSYQQMVEDLSSINQCEVIPSENKELAVLVTDTLTDSEDKQLQDQLNTIKSLKMLSLVSGYETE